MSTTLRTLTATAALAATAAVASADPAQSDRLTVPVGHGVVTGTLAINLSTDLAFKPVSLSPDLWYGVHDKVTVGLIHSGRGTSGFVGSVGQSLCLTGEENGCGSFYPGLGIAGRYDLRRGTTALALDGGLFAGDLDPFTLSAKVGVAARWRKDKLAVEAVPALFVGLTERDAGNDDGMTLPITVSYAVATKLALALQSGLVLPFESTGDTFQVPLSIGGSYAVAPAISVDAAFSLPMIAGGEAVATGTDLRTISIGGAYAF